MSPVQLSALLAILAIGGCSGGWRRMSGPIPQTLPQRAQVQVWQGGRYELLHSVVIVSDTIHGVRYVDPPTCDSCRVALALTEVDSLRRGSKEMAVVRTVWTTGVIVGTLRILSRIFVRMD